jgi:glycosyltransferase involved in cell wall biosynthesis
MNLKSNIDISVILPIYNCKNYISECIDSVLNQTYKNFELIIIDDCSTDGTYELVSSIKTPKIKLFKKEKNTGYTNSLNFGLSIATGKYVARMDGDDVCHLERFEKQINFMENNPDIILCGTNYKILGSDEIITNNYTHSLLMLDLIDKCPFAHPTIFMRTEVLRKYNLNYMSEYEPAEDYKMWTILSKYGKLANLDEILLYYRVHDNQTTFLNRKKQTEISNKISTEYISELCTTLSLSVIIYFTSENVNTHNDILKYTIVEDQIKKKLISKNIQFDDKFFFERKKNYLQQSFNNILHSPFTLLRDLRLFWQFKIYFSNKYALIHIIKCIIFWKSSFYKKLFSN